MRKKDEINNTQSCLNKASDDEPIFVLRATDKLSPLLIALWADLAEEHGCSESKVKEARALAKKMRAWPKRKFPD